MIRAAESAALATVCGAPQNAMPRDCLANLKLAGSKSQLTTIEHSSIAARCRIAMSSAAFAVAAREVDEATQGDDTLMVLQPRG